MECSQIIRVAALKSEILPRTARIPLGDLKEYFDGQEGERPNAIQKEPFLLVSFYWRELLLFRSAIGKY